MSKSSQQRRYLQFTDGKGSLDPNHRIAIIEVESEAEGEKLRGLDVLGWYNCNWAFGLPFDHIRRNYHPNIPTGIYGATDTMHVMEFLHPWHPNDGPWTPNAVPGRARQIRKQTYVLNVKALANT